MMLRTFVLAICCVFALSPSWAQTVTVAPTCRPPNHYCETRRLLGGHRLTSLSGAAGLASHHGAKAAVQAGMLHDAISQHGMDGSPVLERAAATHPPRLGPLTAGAGAEPIVSVPVSHPINSMSGVLAQVGGVTSVSDPTGAGRWSLQLNTNRYNTRFAAGKRAARDGNSSSLTIQATYTSNIG